MIRYILHEKRNPLHTNQNDNFPSVACNVDVGVWFTLNAQADEKMQALARTVRDPRRCLRYAASSILIAYALTRFAGAQTNCADGNSVLDDAPPKGISTQELIQKLAAQETKVRDARAHYTFTQDVLVQTLNGTSVDGQFHEITAISYDEKGKRIENVRFSEVPTLQGVQLSPTDLDDIRTFMPWILTADQLSEYKISYKGQQHVDDLDTYVFYVEPARQEKDKRYFQGRVWVDNRDVQIVKLCGKSVPEQIRRKKKDPIEVRPTFVGYRQLVDGYWFPAYARVDDTLTFGVQSVHLREVVKLKDYKKREPSSASVSKP